MCFAAWVQFSTEAFWALHAAGALFQPRGGLCGSFLMAWPDFPVASRSSSSPTISRAKNRMPASTMNAFVVSRSKVNRVEIERLTGLEIQQIFRECCNDLPKKRFAPQWLFI